MSAYSISSPSIEHTRWYLIRPPSFACTCRNDTSCDSVAEYSLTGTLTSPNDTAPFQIARISYLRELVGCRPPGPSIGGRRPERTQPDPQAVERPPSRPAVEPVET